MSTWRIESTGPKISSVAAGMSGVTPSRMVGPIQYPGSPSTVAFRPSTRTRAPAASAWSMYPMIRFRASGLMIAPMSLPRVIFSAWVFILSMMGATSPTATMTEAAMHRCPAQPKDEATTVWAVRSSSASGTTTRWFLAPPRQSMRFPVAVPRW